MVDSFALRQRTLQPHLGFPGLLVISVARYPLRRITVQISSFVIPIGLKVTTTPPPTNCTSRTPFNPLTASQIALCATSVFASLISNSACSNGGSFCASGSSSAIKFLLRRNTGLMTTPVASFRCGGGCHHPQFRLDHSQV